MTYSIYSFYSRLIEIDLVIDTDHLAKKYK